MTLDLLGEIPTDPAVRDAVKRRGLLLEITPGSPAAKAVTAIGARLAARDADRPQRGQGAGRFAPGLSSTSSAPWPPSAGRACVKASTSLRCTSHDFTLTLSTGSRPGRAEALAVDDAHAAQAVALGVAQERVEALARLVAPQAVQVDLGLHHPDAAAELAHDVDADAAAAVGERVVGVEQRLGVELVGDRFDQRGRLVALALARDRRRARPGQRRRARPCARRSTAPTLIANRSRSRRSAASIASAARRARPRRRVAAACIAARMRGSSASELARWPMRRRSQQPPLGERHHGRAVTDDEVIEHAHVDQGERALQGLGQELVGARRLGERPRVVVGEDHRRGAELERALDDLARIDARLRQRAAKHLLEADEPVLRVEEEHREDLVLAAAELQVQVFLDLGRRIEHRPRVELARDRAPRELEHRRDLGALGRAEPLDALELLGLGAQQAARGRRTRRAAAGRAAARSCP